MGGQRAVDRNASFNVHSDTPPFGHPCPKARDTFRISVDINALTPSQVEDELGSDMYRSIDVYWTLDALSLKAMQNQFGTTSIRHEIEQFLPTVLKPTTMEATTESLHALTNTPLFKWSGPEPGSEIKILLETICNMKEGRVTATKFLTSPWLKKVAACMAWYCRCEQPGEKTGVKQIFGKEAIEYTIKTLRKQYEAGLATTRGQPTNRPTHRPTDRP